MHDQPTPTIIWGNGLIGSALKRNEAQFKGLNLSIIAAGVSDSKNATEADYKREASFLENCLTNADQFQRNILYISTYSVHDKSLQNERYVQTRIYNEALIQHHNSNHTILRLTNVVGHNGNPKNILNFITHRVANSIPFSAWKNTLRNFVDAEDIGKFILWAATEGLLKQKMELIHPVSYQIEDIIKVIESHYSTSAQVEWAVRAPNTFSSNSYSNNFFERHANLTSSNYLQSLLQKYFPLG